MPASLVTDLVELASGYVLAEAPVAAPPAAMLGP